MVKKNKDTKDFIYAALKFRLGRSIDLNDAKAIADFLSQWLELKPDTLNENDQG